MKQHTVGTYTRKSTTVQAIQFDGSISGLMTIFNVAADHRNLVITIRFDNGGSVANVSYGMASTTLTFGPTDWVVFSQDSPLAFVLSDEAFQQAWQPGAQ